MSWKPAIFMVVIALASCSEDGLDNQRSSRSESTNSGVSAALGDFSNCPKYWENFTSTLFQLDEGCLNSLPPVSEMMVKLKAEGYIMEYISDELLAVAFFQALNQGSVESDGGSQSSFGLTDSNISVTEFFFDISNLHFSTTTSSGTASSPPSCTDSKTINASASLNASANLDISIPRTEVANFPAPVLPRHHYIHTYGNVKGPIQAQINGHISGNMRNWSGNLNVTISGSKTAHFTVTNTIRKIDGMRYTNEVGYATVVVTYTVTDSLSLMKDCTAGFRSHYGPVRRNIEVPLFHATITGGIFRPNRDGALVTFIRQKVENYLNNGNGRDLVKTKIEAATDQYLASYARKRQEIVNQLIDRLPGPKCSECGTTTTTFPVTTTTQMSVPTTFEQTTTTIAPITPTTFEQTTTTIAPITPTTFEQTTTTIAPITPTTFEQTTTTIAPTPPTAIEW